jgi:predicted RND superfamily exporter protein
MGDLRSPARQRFYEFLDANLLSETATVIAARLQEGAEFIMQPPDGSRSVSSNNPLVIMIPIPLSLVGILPAHALMGAFFTATSMIGFIALAGIMVRNGILLIDFVELALAEGRTLGEALVEAGAVRTRPIVLTAGAVVMGAVVILFDPIFQGLAIALMFGSLASTVLTLIVVPVLYYMAERHKYKTPLPPSWDDDGAGADAEAAPAA